MKTRLNNAGSLVTALAAGIILAIGSLAALNVIRNSRNSEVRSREVFLAEAYATELLEYFISRPVARVAVVMNIDPVSKVPPGYKLCSYVNLKNPANGTLSQPYPLADLPPTALLKLRAQAANRYFRIDVINVTTKTVRTDVCNQTTASVVRNAGETFLFTVGVVWTPVNHTSGTPDSRVELASISQDF